jgi:hypothetical protein
MVVTIDRVIAMARQRQGLAQQDDVLALWILAQEERLYDTTVRSHFGGKPRRLQPGEPGYVWPISPWEPGWDWPRPVPAEPPVLPDIAREYPRDDSVPLLMTGAYAEAYVCNLFAMSAYDDGDSVRYDLFSVKANDIEQAWRSRFFRENPAPRAARLESRNE